MNHSGAFILQKSLYITIQNNLECFSIIYTTCSQAEPDSPCLFGKEKNESEYK